MLNALFTKIFGSRNERIVKKLGRVVDRVNAFEEAIKALSEEELKAKETKLIARDNAQKFAEKHKGWVYQIPENTAGNLKKDLNDLLEDKPEPEPTEEPKKTPELAPEQAPKPEVAEEPAEISA